MVTVDVGVSVPEEVGVVVRELVWDDVPVAVAVVVMLEV